MLSRARSQLDAFVDSSTNQGENDMNKDRIVGAAKQAIGTVKEVAGKVIGDAKLVADGRTEKAEGKIQSAIGDAADTLTK
jgi:uncharacterized protein YjbJ (UPF0337 family)